MSSVSTSGTSMAGKWLPRAYSDQARRRAYRPSEPRGGSSRQGDAHARQQLIAIDGVLGQLGRRVGPLAEILDDPCEQADGRVVQRVGECLWPGRLHVQVAEDVLSEVVESLGALT